MVILQVIYLYQEDYQFDWHYWRTTHRAIIVNYLKPYIKEVTRDFGLKGFNSSAPAVVLSSRIIFESMEEYEKVPKAYIDEIIADCKNFTNISPIISLATTDEPEL